MTPFNVDYLQHLGFGHYFLQLRNRPVTVSQLFRIIQNEVQANSVCLEDFRKHFFPFRIWLLTHGEPILLFFMWDFVPPIINGLMYKLFYWSNKSKPWCKSISWCKIYYPRFWRKVRAERTLIYQNSQSLLHRVVCEALLKELTFDTIQNRVMSSCKLVILSRDISGTTTLLSSTARWALIRSLEWFLEMFIRIIRSRLSSRFFSQLNTDK